MERADLTSSTVTGRGTAGRLRSGAASRSVSRSSGVAAEVREYWPVRRRSSEPWRASIVIGKVVRGANVGGLLRYLYGPGQANEHTDPHLVAGFGDPQELEPDRRADGSRDLRRLTGLLLQPLALDPFGGPEKPVWHCSVRAAPGDRVLSDAEWGQVAASVVERTGVRARGRRPRGAVGGGPARGGSHSHRGDAGPAGRRARVDLE